MRKTVLLTFLAIVLAIPLQARTRNESYISYDDGGTIVRQGDDGREIDARVNLPLFPGDEVITNRRGRAEVRLADGNFLGIDRATSVRLRSVLDSYDADSNDTIVVLRYGHVAVYRTDDAAESFRLDTDTASYFAGDEAVFSVDTDAGGRDHVQVFDGAIEVRTPSRATRVRAGESANVDDRGLYDLATDTRNSADDFERWFLARAERYGAPTSRYLDRSVAYYDDELAGHGTWTFIAGYGWGWRPYVAAGWRPYYNGQWIYSPSGCLVWVSYEPWGWVPYHYGRWAWDPIYGWFWIPGAAYAPAWVYWWYGPGYLGWAPAGWYDCYRPYYDWAYGPYRHGLDFGFGFYGRVHVRDVDLRPWTFIDANTILSQRVDRAALGTDVVRARLIREPGFATISGTPARFTRQDLRDPSAAVNTIYRRGLTGGTGGANTIAPPDLTPFFRRDPVLPGTIKDRIVRTRPEGAVRTVGGTTGLAPVGGGSIAPIGSGNVAPIGRGNVAPIGGGNVAPTTGSIQRGDPGSTSTSRPVDTGRDSGGRISRGGGNQPANPDRTNRDGGNENNPPNDSWRGHIARPDAGTSAPSSNEPSNKPRQDWRGKLLDEQPSTQPSTPPDQTPSRSRAVGRERGSDVPRRVIDGIGGARISRGGGKDSTPPPRSTESRPAHESSPPPPPPQHHDSGGSRDSGGSHRDSGGGNNSGGGRDSGGSHNSGGSQSSGGHVERGKS